MLGTVEDIVYVGDNGGVEEFVGEATKVIDLEGKFLCPGLMDGHLHGPQPYYEQMFQISIPDGCMDNEEYLRIIREFVEAHPDDEVYYGGAFMQNAYLQEDGSNPGPQASDLDAICADKPIMIRDVSHHAYWVNSKALEIAGITAETEDPDGGTIARDADGNPSGLLTDAAKNMVTKIIEVPYTVENMQAAYEEFQKYCHSVGITGLTNINLSGVEREHAEALHNMDEAGNLHLRQRFLVWATPNSDYGAVRDSLDAYELAQSDNGERDARHTMVHVCAITEEDIERAAKLDVISCLQFLWMYDDPLCKLESAFIGRERAMAMYPSKNMLEAGCLISGGSDGAVTPYDKRLEIETGITRNSPFPEEEDTDMTRWPEQGLTAYQMLEIYSKNVAYEIWMEDIIGTVEVGKKADLVVFENNLLEIDPTEISDTAVVYTISNGDIVYEG